MGWKEQSGKKERHQEKKAVHLHATLRREKMERERKRNQKKN